MAGRLRLKGQSLLVIGRGASNAHQLSLEAKISYPTVKRWVDEADKIQMVDLTVLPSILIDGLGFTSEQMMNMQIKDLFEYVPDQK